MEISEFFNSASRDPRNLLAGIWKEEDRREEKRNSSALPVQWLAASRTIRADSGIEADKKTRYDIVRDKDITHY